MTKTFKTTARALFATAALLTAASGAQAFGFDICEDVTIKVVNNSGEPIQVYDINYYDYGQSLWRSEPTPNRVIAHGASWSDERNLEDVEDASTRVNIKYRTLGSNGRWKDKHSAKSSKFTCNEGDRVTITID